MSTPTLQEIEARMNTRDRLVRRFEVASASTDYHFENITTSAQIETGPEYKTVFIRDVLAIKALMFLVYKNTTNIASITVDLTNLDHKIYIHTYEDPSLETLVEKIINV